MNAHECGDCSGDAVTAAQKDHDPSLQVIPGKPVAHNYGLLSRNHGLLRGVVACCFGYFAFVRLAP